MTQPEADALPVEQAPTTTGKRSSAADIIALERKADETQFVEQVRDAELRDAAPWLRQTPGLPGGGWRRAAQRLSFGRLQPAPSARQSEYEHQVDRVRTPLNGNRHIVVLAYGTGVGKTITTGCLGLQFATHRDERIALIDADQTAGNLANRFAIATSQNLQGLLANQQNAAPVDSILELRRYAANANRLDIYSADHTQEFTADHHQQSLELLNRFYEIVITDLGSAGLRDLPQVLDTATDVVVVTGTNMDAVERSRKALDRLEQLGHPHLAREALVTIVARSSKDTTLAQAARNGGVHVQTLIGHFQRRCRAVVLVPYSARLADGVHVEHETLDPAVAEAYLDAAGYVATGFQPLRTRTAITSAAVQQGDHSGRHASEASKPVEPHCELVNEPAAALQGRLVKKPRRSDQRDVGQMQGSTFAGLPHYRGH